MENRATEARTTRPILIGLLLATALRIAACGGGEGESAPETPTQSTGPGTLDQGGIVCEFIAILFGGECIGIGNVPPCSDDPFNNPLGLPDCTDTTTSGSNESTWITPHVYGMPDTEPNDTIATAAQARLNSRLPQGGRGGFSVISTFNSLSDPADVFIFTLTASGNLEFTLCFGDHSCSYSAGDRIDIGTAYISVLDQYGAVIWSARDYPDSGNLQEFWLDAGVPYYVMVVAVDTMGSDLAYRLNVIEAQNQVKKLPPELVGAEEPAAKPKAPILTLAGSGGAPGTVTFTLDWLPPTENEDGTSLLELSGYVIYYGGMVGGSYDNSVRLDNSGLTSYVLDRPNNDWIVAMTAFNSDGLESDFSNEVIVAHSPD